MDYELKYKKLPDFKKVYLISYNRNQESPMFVYESSGDGMLRLYFSSNLPLFPEKQLYSLLSDLSRENSKSKPFLMAHNELEIWRSKDFIKLAFEMGFEPKEYTDLGDDSKSLYPLPLDRFDLILIFEAS